MSDSGLLIGRGGALCCHCDSIYGRQVRTAIYPALAFERSLEGQPKTVTSFDPTSFLMVVSAKNSI
jgi:hypothetical protein